MCGISGYITKNTIDEDDLSLIRDELVHRGPDGFGNFTSEDKKVGLSHRRLSIVDLSENGSQPMASLDNNYAITYNGEVYNHKEIRIELETKGYKFKSSCDTEVILYSYIEWGNDCLNKFNGMFAFAIYDKQNRQLFMARDRFGIKPFYYAFLENGDFVFASEIKAILKHPNFIKEINIPAVGDYFKYRYIPAPATIWNNVYKLEHSYCAVYDIETQSFNKNKYYDLNSIVKSKNTTIKDVEDALDYAIKMQLEADVEVGTFLSGGMDSSSITAISKKYKKDIKTFSIGFVPEEFSELKYSKEVAEFLGVEHIYEMVDNIDENIIDKLSYFYDEPLADSSCVPTYILSEMTAKHLKVVLSGDGGDEIFSGYNWYRKYKEDYKKYRTNVVNKVRALFFDLPKAHIDNFEEYYNKLLLNRFDNSIFKEMFPEEVYNQIEQGDKRLMEKYLDDDFKSVRAIQFVDINTFMVDDILVKVDRATMAHSLESRVPLLDHNLVEAVLCLPESEFPQDTTGKTVLSNMVCDKLPNSVFNRMKKGFSAPIMSWSFMEDNVNKLAEGKLVKDGYIKKKFIEELLENKYKNSQAILWMIFVLDNWMLKWLK